MRETHGLKHIYIYMNGIDICTHGAANMTGHRSGVIEKVKNVSHADILSTHCIIHRVRLVAKKGPQNSTK